MFCKVFGFENFLGIFKKCMCLRLYFVICMWERMMFERNFGEYFMFICDYCNFNFNIM